MPCCDSIKRELKNRLLKLVEIEEMNVDLRC